MIYITGGKDLHIFLELKTLIKNFKRINGEIKK